MQTRLVGVAFEVSRWHAINVVYICQSINGQCMLVYKIDS